MGTAAFAIVSIATTAIGAGVSYVQQRKAAAAQEAAAKYNASVREQQARHQEDVAAESYKRGSQQKRRRLAAMRAQAAGSGVSYTGSVVEHYAQSAFQLERDLQTRFWEAQAGASRQRSQARMDLWEGKQRATATRMKATASLFNSAGGIAKQGFDFGQQF